MNKYEIWDRTSKINNMSAIYFLRNKPFKDYNGDIILIYGESSDKVVQVECKEILAKIYDININLPLDDFMSEYFAKLEDDSPSIAPEAQYKELYFSKYQ